MYSGKRDLQVAKVEQAGDRYGGDRTNNLREIEITVSFELFGILTTLEEDRVRRAIKTHNISCSEREIKNYAQ